MVGCEVDHSPLTSAAKFWRVALAFASRPQLSSFHPSIGHQPPEIMTLDKSARPLAQCLRCTRHERIALPILIRSFSTTASSRDGETVATDRAPFTFNPETVSTPRLERKMMREQHQMPIGSRRRRRAIASSANIPFQELPYQCFQEARRFLQEDRAEKLKDIEKFRRRIEKLMDSVPVTDEKVAEKEHRLNFMRKRLEHTKILADINDPIVKKRFEDGQGQIRADDDRDVIH